MMVVIRTWRSWVNSQPYHRQREHASSPLTFFIGDVDAAPLQEVGGATESTVLGSSQVEPGNPAFEKAVRSIYFDYFEIHIAPTLRSIQQSQRELASQISELRAGIEKQSDRASADTVVAQDFSLPFALSTSTTIVSQTPDIIAAVESVQSSEVASARTSSFCASATKANNADSCNGESALSQKFAKPVLQPTQGHLLYNTLSREEPDTCVSTHCQRQFEALQQELQELREELRSAKEAFSWRRLGEASPAPICSDAASDVGSFIGSLGGSVAESVANSAVGTSFSKGIRDVRERLAVRRQRKSLMMSNSPLLER